MTPWSSLEQLPSLRGTAGIWRSLLDEDFETFQDSFLQKSPERAAGVFCERCYCTHEVVSDEACSVFSVQCSEPDRTINAPRSHGPTQTSAHKSINPPIHQSDFSLVAACRCPDTHCPDIHVTPADLELWALSWPRLGRALCGALGISPRLTDMKLFNTHQIGIWSASAVPVILTIQSERPQLPTIISQLSSRLRRPFILLAPTSENLDALAQEFLANAGGEYFARFNPDTKEALEEDTARKAFALVKSLDNEGREEPPAPLTVFCGYCIDGMSISELVTELECSRTTIVRRLRSIRKRTGIEPKALRQLSAHLEKIRDDLADPRASRISARRAIYDEDEDLGES
jgi:hypothetical protein